MIAIISLVMMISAYMIANALSRTTAEVNIQRDQRTLDALRQAKTALIAYAASEQWQLYKDQQPDQPGALPCPDIVHNGTESEEGDSDCIAAGFSNSTNLIGRLPWKTLGIEDLRDASGERLWYALSHNFRKLSGTTVINSDTQPCDTPACLTGQNQLAVTGTAPASNVVAIVFAPGAPLDLRQFGGPLQNRPSDHIDPAYKDPTNYLEQFSLGDGVHYTFATNGLPSDILNDRLVVITQADLMAAVEPVVAALIERDVKPYLDTYSTEWSYDASWGTASSVFPYPATFAAPDPGTSATRAQDAYLGSTAETSGLLPISASVSYPWTSGSGLVSNPPISGTAVVSSESCASVSTPLSGLQCTFHIAGSGPNPIRRPRFRVQGQIGPNAGISFPKLPATSEVLATFNGNPVSLTDPKIKASLSTDGIGTVAYEGTYWRNCSGSPCPGTFQILIPDVTVSTITSASSSSNPSAYWFIANEWYRQTYYVVSPGYLPGAGAGCTNNCLTVNKLSSPTNKHAILVLAGRSFNGTARPSSSLANYLEGENTTPGDSIFEHRTGVPTTINDRVVVISP